MRRIFRIARLELYTLFFSPVAWIVLIVFAYQTGDEFLRSLKEGVYQYRFYQPYPDGFTAYFLGFIGVVQRGVYLYIPLLTMGLVSREVSSGSIKLLLSSPVKTREIILGKYLAMLIYGLSFIAIITVFSVGICMIVERPDVPLIFAAMLSVYLLLCTYSAIGLFISCLTSYQIVAAIGTFVVLAALNYVGGLWHDIPIMKNIAYFLSIAGRAGKIGAGLIDTRDLYYFVSIGVLFLGFSMLVLGAKRRARALWVTVGRYLLLAAVVVGVGVLTSTPSMTFYVDMTRSQRLTLTKETQAVLKKMKEPVTIKTFVNVLGGAFNMARPRRQDDDKDFFSRYQRFMSRAIRYEYVYYYDSCSPCFAFQEKGFKQLSIEKKRDTILNFLGERINNILTGPEAEKLANLDEEGNQYVRQLNYNGHSTFLRLYNNMDRLPGEAEIGSALARLVAQAPKVAFLAGHFERGLNSGEGRGYNLGCNIKGDRNSLINQGFDFTQINLDTIPSVGSIDILVIADPMVGLTASEVQKIRAFIASGGNLLIAGEPGRQQILAPLLDDLGITMNKDSIGFLTAVLRQNPALHTLTWNSLAHDTAKISFPGACTLSHESVAGFQIESLADKPVAFAVERQIGNKSQRIIVLGDADCLSNAELARVNLNTENGEFLKQIYRWLGGEALPLDIYRPKATDNVLRIGRKQMLWLRPVLLYALPVLLLFMGAFLLIRRRNK